MRTPTMIPYGILSDLTRASRTAALAFEQAESACDDGDSLEAAGHLDDGMEAVRRLARLMGYEVTPTTARRMGSV